MVTIVPGAIAFQALYAAALSSGSRGIEIDNIRQLYKI
jgi:hypothetical protein